MTKFTTNKKKLNKKQNKNKKKNQKKEIVKHHIRGSCLQDNLDRIKDFHHEGYAEAIRGGQGQHFMG